MIAAIFICIIATTQVNAGRDEFKLLFVLAALYMACALWNMARE